MPTAPLPRVALPALLAVLVAGCPQPDNPFGPPVVPPPAAAAPIAFGFGGAGLDRVQAVAVGGSGEIFVAGEFAGSVDFDPSGATQSITSLASSSQFVARYSTNGDFVWAVQLGDSPDDLVSALAIDPAGNLVIGGSFSGTIDLDPGPGVTLFASNGGRDAFVASYTSAGALRWARAFGGTGDDAVLAVAATADAVLAAGSFSGGVTVDPAPGIAMTSTGGVDGFLAAWSSAGTARWVFPVGGPQDDAATAVAAGPGGAIYLAGSFTGVADLGPGSASAPVTSLGGPGGFLAQYDSDGALGWARGLSGIAGVELIVNGLAAAATGVHVAGSFAGTLDFDAGSGVASRSSVGSADGFVVGYDAGGAFSWVAAMGGTAATEVRGVAVGPSGDVLVTGAFGGTARFDPGAAATSLIAHGSAGATDGFTAAYSATGAFRWAVGFGAPVADPAALSHGAAVAVDGAGSVVTGGQFFGSADVDPGASLVVLTSQGGADGFVVKLTASGALATRP
jgi:hypothetical protein